MNLIYPTKDDIMNLFKDRSGFSTVYAIATSLVTPHVQRSNVLDEEWKHVQGFLHQLKSDGFLLAENEGHNILHEKFSSTPDRIEKYFKKDQIIDNADLTQKTNGELQEIMRNSIDNSYVPSSIYNKAKLELEFRNQLMSSQKNEIKSDDEILKLSPEFYGVGINLKSFWKKIKSWF